MDYKEKFEDFLDKMQGLLDNAKKQGHIIVRVEDLENAFPELKESEDTKIKMSLIQYISELNQDVVHLHPGIETCNEWIAWLEKQGESDETKAKIFLINKGYPIDANGTFPTYEEMYNIIREGLEEQGEQKPDNKVEPKFKVGDWITDGQLTCKVLSVTSKSYELYLYNDDYCHFETDVQSIDEHYYLWTIKDAKKGDILTSTSISFHSNCTFIFNGLDNWKFDEPNGDRAVATGYCCLTASADKMEFGVQGPDCVEVNTVKPATKIQCDLLFQKMKEAGYEWDFEKKELMKIEDEEYNGEDYGIDSLYHAQRILEKTLGSVDGYQTDDGILSHKCAITAVKKLYEQKPAWSEMDENIISEVIQNYESGFLPSVIERDRIVKTLKSLKDRVQPKQEWSEEDKEIIDGITSYLCTHDSCELDGFNEWYDWLKSLKERITWNPSDEQMSVLENFIGTIPPYEPMFKVLKSLYNELKKL